MTVVGTGHHSETGFYKKFNKKTSHYLSDCQLFKRQSEDQEACPSFQQSKKFYPGVSLPSPSWDYNHVKHTKDSSCQKGGIKHSSRSIAHRIDFRFAKDCTLQIQTVEVKIICV